MKKETKSYAFKKNNVFFYFKYVTEKFQILKMMKENFFSNTYINRNIFLFKKEIENQNELKFIRIKVINKNIFY